MAAVMIGVDPHKGSHTAVAIGADEVPVGLVRVRACAAQAERLLTWAKSWPERIWAVEGAAGLGHLLAQQLVAAGERVLDVQPELAARVRLLATGAVNKNDPGDARSVAARAAAILDQAEPGGAVRRPAWSWPRSSPPACAASTYSCARPGRSRRWRSGPPARPSPRSSGSARSSPPP